MDMYIYYYYALRATATYTHHYQVLQETANIQLDSPAEGYNSRTTYTTKTKFLHKKLVYPRKMPIAGYCLKQVLEKLERITHGVPQSWEVNNLQFWRALQTWFSPLSRHHQVHPRYFGYRRAL